MNPKVLCTLAVAAVLSACAPALRVESVVPAGASIQAGSTYSWRAGSGGVLGDLAMTRNPELDGVIRSVIDEALQARGLRLDAGGAGALGVAYVAAVQDEVRLTEVDEFLRYRRRPVVVSYTDVDTYEVGSLIIDLSDGATGDLVWRGATEAELHSDTRNYREAKLHEAVEAILAQLPIR